MDILLKTVKDMQSEGVMLHNFVEVFLCVQYILEFKRGQEEAHGAFGCQLPVCIVSTAYNVNNAFLKLYCQFWSEYIHYSNFMF